MILKKLMKLKKFQKRIYEISRRILLEDFEKRLEVNLNLDEKNEIDTLGGFIFFSLEESLEEEKL